MMSVSLFVRSTSGLFAWVVVAGLLPAAEVTVSDAASLRAAIDGGSVGDTIRLAPGTYEVTQSLRPKSGMSIIGSGRGRTVIRNAASWTFDPANNGDDQTFPDHWNEDQYLFSMRDASTNVTISHLSMRGPDNAPAALPGAVFSRGNDGLKVHHTEIRNFQWSGIRTFVVDNSRIHNNHFIDAGGKRFGTTGPEGGGIFAQATTGSHFHNNTFEKTDGAVNYYGIKGRLARDTVISNNTIRTNFAIELPFENDRNVVIRNNYLDGVVSVPKQGGGAIPDAGSTFAIRENYFTRSYSIEGPRNEMVIADNLFDFDVDDDIGNLISNFATQSSPGGVEFTGNVVINPGRGIYWNQGSVDDLLFANNEIYGDEPGTPPEGDRRTIGLFEFYNADSSDDFVIRDNIIELTGLDRDLIRNGYPDVTIENNRLSGISDLDQYDNLQTGAVQGRATPLDYYVGANDEFRVFGGGITAIPEPSGVSLLGLAAIAAARRRRRLRMVVPGSAA